MQLHPRKQRKLEEKKKELPPVKYQPYDPENGFISRDDFMAKRRKRNEAEAKAKAVMVEAMGEEPAEEAPVVQAEENSDASTIDSGRKRRTFKK